MHLRLIQPAFFACFFSLLVHSAFALDPFPDNTPSVTPLPTAPPTPDISPTPEIWINDDLIPPTPAPVITPPPQETPSPSPIATIPPVPSPTPADPGPTPFPTPWQPPTATPAPGEFSVTRSGVSPDEIIPVVITYGEGQETQATISQGLMVPVGVPRQKSVTVSLLLPSTYAGQPVKLGLYDGGQVGPVAPPGTPVAPSGTRTGGIEALTFVVNAARDGTVHFNFEAGAIFGLYRLVAAVGPNQYLLQFHAVRPRGDNPLGTTVAIRTPTPPPLPAASPTPERWPTPSP